LNFLENFNINIFFIGDYNCRFDFNFNNIIGNGLILIWLQLLTLIFYIYYIRRMWPIGWMLNIYSLHAGINVIRIQRIKRMIECGLVAFG
jgi:hypothetical protein